MKKMFSIALLVLLPVFAFADTTATVAVPDHCTVIDTDGVSHAYSGNYFGICALQAAVDAGGVSGVQLSNKYPTFGLFVTSIGGIVADPNSQYWTIYKNAATSTLGLSTLPVAVGDTVTLELHDYGDTYLGSRLTLTVISLIAAAPTQLAPSGGTNRHDPFDAQKALNYLWGTQHPDGSFGSGLLNDWVAIGTSVGGYGDMRNALMEYERTHPQDTSSVTDTERHAMALEALGIDPRSGTQIDYIAPIVNSFDGTQIGDRGLVNDDIFAIFPLLHAGFTAHDAIIASTTEFIISKQTQDGSWENSIDLTAAAIQALALVNADDSRGARRKGLDYLHLHQAGDASIGNAFSTSWVIQGIAASGESFALWDQGVSSIDYYLATQQGHDGSVSTSTETDMRIWATAYAIPASEHRTWDSLLASFPMPAPIAPIATSTISTTTTLATPAAQTRTVTEKRVAVRAPTPKKAPRAEQAASSSPQVASAAAAMPFRGTPTDAWHAIVSFFSALF